jgi:hypothetical protein
MRVGPVADFKPFGMPEAPEFRRTEVCFIEKHAALPRIYTANPDFNGKRIAQESSQGCFLRGIKRSGSTACTEAGG